MANIKINQIELTGSLTSGDSFIVLDEETQATKRASLSTISDYVKEDNLVHPAVDDMAERNSLSVEDGDVVRVKSTGELFVWDQTNTKWNVIPHSSIKKEFFHKTSDLVSDYVKIYVKTSGDDENGDGTEQYPFASVERATKLVPTGYSVNIIIKVSPGEYNDTEWSVPLAQNSWAVYVVGDLSSEGEAISITQDNFPASSVAHPSGLGNYISFREFNFPAWQTPIPGNLPTIYPTYNQGSTPEYMLVMTESTSNNYFNIPAYPVLPGSNNVTGKIRLLATGIYDEGEYRLVHKSSFPSFPNLYSINNIYQIQNIKNSAIYQRYVNSGVRGSFLDLPNNGFFMSFDNSSAYSSVLSKTTYASSFPVRVNFVYQQYPTNLYYVFNAFTGCYSNMGISLQNARMYVDRSIIATVYQDDAKILVESHNRPYVIPGFSVIHYMGYVDFIGGGDGIDVQSGQITTYNTLTFDGVSKPLLLHNGSTFFRRGGSPIGTCTSYSEIGVNCSTSHPTVPSQPAISVWNVQNTVTTGEEIKVGNNPVTTYASLPQTDFALGNDSMGAIGR